MDKYGFVRTAAITPQHIEIGNPIANAEEIIRLIDEAVENDTEIMVFPELCITGYTCGDLFNQKKLIDEAMNGLTMIRNHLKSIYSNPIVVVGMPIRKENKLFNCAVVLNGIGDGIISVIPKTYIPNYNEFYEMRYFSSANEAKNNTINMYGRNVYFGPNVLMNVANKYKFAVEICEDAWTPIPPSAYHCLAGAEIICNLSASNELVAKKNYRRNLIKSLSATQVCGYIYASASMDESTSDTVYSGHKLICENGGCLNESAFPNKDEIIYGDIDIELICADRTKSTSYLGNILEYKEIYVERGSTLWESNRKVSTMPFVPREIKERAEEILNIQAMGLAQKLKKTGIKKAVIGISGGLDSTLALLATVRAFDIDELDRKGIIGITMPGFGTTNTTLNNSLDLMDGLGISQRTININNACIQHLKDINHKENVFDIAYENTQARERTQILMDVANMEGGLVIGTGDLSELALGWCTYNGDHMSMYGLNSSIPKTLVRHLVRYFADMYEEIGEKNNNAKRVANCLYSILDTPISPELLPPNPDGTIAQKTENSIGNYNIHDFVMYYMIRFGFSPSKIYKLLINSWDNIDKKDAIKNMKIFYRRFFSQQFKRNCIPDGIKVGSISLSPRADWRMPSEASVRIWMDELERIEKTIQ